jgi:hypothetical protein
MDLTDYAQDRKQWRALVNAEMNIRIPKMFVIFSVSAHLGVSQEELSSMSVC